MVCKKYHPLTFSPTSVPQCCKILIGGPVTERQVVKTSYGCVHGSHDKPYLGILFGQFPWKPRPSHREGQHHSLVMVLLLVLFHPSANKQQLKTTTTTTTHLHPLHTYFTGQCWRRETTGAGAAFACILSRSVVSDCDTMDYSPPGSTALGILRARIWEWVAVPPSRGAS